MALEASELAYFTGTQKWYQHSLFRKFHHTDGVNYLAQEGQAHWLINAIFSWQTDKRIKNNPELQEFQFWELKVKENRSAILTCFGDEDKIILTQQIPFTDFPLPEIELYLVEKVLMLPSEY